MSEINTVLGDLKSRFSEHIKQEQDILKRYCGMCKKEYSYEEVMKEYPELIHESLTTIWKNSEINFYCSYCHLLKLVRLIKKNKKNVQF